MSKQITKSQIAALSNVPQNHLRVDDFQQAVLNHVEALVDYERHSRLVLEGKAQHYPPPEPHPLVNAAVARERHRDGSMRYYPDYEIIDDPVAPPPPARVIPFGEKKAALLNGVSQEEGRVSAAILPAGKRRLYQMRRNDIFQEDNKRVERMLEADRKRPDSDRRYTTTVQLMDLKADALKQRSKGDVEFMAMMDEIEAKMARLARHGAELHAAIEDLTEENIDAWTMAPFPKP